MQSLRCKALFCLFLSIQKISGRYNVPAIFNGTIQKHNFYRAMHKVGPLFWNNKLTVAADERASKCSLAQNISNRKWVNTWATSIFGGMTSENLSTAVVEWYSQDLQVLDNWMADSKLSLSGNQFLKVKSRCPLYVLFPCEVKHHHRS